MNDGASLPDSPYKGLARFDDSELDERFFFGRDRETEIVASNLIASRLSVLYGPSGVGKSSLLRAGVVRRLRALVPAGGEGGDENGALPVVVDQWRDDPFAAIAAAAGTPVPESPSELADVLAERSAQIGGEIYLVLDQMEEYFVYHGRDAGGPLREALAEILTRPTLRVHVLLGIRDDALADLDAFKGRVPGLFGNVLRLDHLDVDSARAAIVNRWPSSRRWAARTWWPSRHSWRRSSTKSRRAGSNGGSRAAGSSRVPPGAAASKLRTCSS